MLARKDHVASKESLTLLKSACQTSARTYKPGMAHMMLELMMVHYSDALAKQKKAAESVGKPNLQDAGRVLFPPCVGLPLNIQADNL